MENARVVANRLAHDNEQTIRDISNTYALPFDEIQQKINNYHAIFLVSYLSQTVNSYSSRTSDFGSSMATILMGEHRTLQQSMIGVLFACLKHYGENATHDARNDYAVEKCQELFPEDSNVHMPLI